MKTLEKLRENFARLPPEDQRTILMCIFWMLISLALVVGSIV
jgi:hypothetical protein